MEDKKDINCEELAKKMNECLEIGDDEKCREFVMAFDTSCKNEEKNGILSWFSSEPKKEEKTEEKTEEKKEE